MNKRDSELLTHLRRQVWFVCLMVFAIGWSGIALASSQVMHEQVINEIRIKNSNAQDQPARNSLSLLADSEFLKDHKSPEHQHLKPHHSDDSSSVHQMESMSASGCNEHVASDSHHKNTSDCTSLKADQAQNLSCSDCMQLHCQTLSSYIDSALPISVIALAYDHLQDFDSHYTAQHFSGFWQEILRPPKA